MILTLAWWPRRARNHAASGTEPRMELTDGQWLVIEDLFPHPVMTPRGGRPRVPPRDCLEGILWMLRTGARRKDLPNIFPSPATCWCPASLENGMATRWS
jgi:transposase